jgi:hypothetical protein
MPKNYLSVRQTEILLQVFEYFEEASLLSNFFDTRFITPAKLRLAMQAGKNFLLQNPALNQKIQFQITHDCKQKFRTKKDLILASRYLGYQESPHENSHYEIRECLYCGSSFSAQKIPKNRFKITKSGLSLDW